MASFQFRVITRHSLVRAKGEVFVYCIFFCSLFLSTISRQPAGRFTPNFACGRTLVLVVSSPFLGISRPGEGGKGGNVECEWQVCVSSTDALVTIVASDCRLLLGLMQYFLITVLLHEHFLQYADKKMECLYGLHTVM